MVSGYLESAFFGYLALLMTNENYRVAPVSLRLRHTKSVQCRNALSQGKTKVHLIPGKELIKGPYLFQIRLRLDKSDAFSRQKP